MNNEETHKSLRELDAKVSKMIGDPPRYDIMAMDPEELGYCARVTDSGPWYTESQLTTWLEKEQREGRYSGWRIAKRRRYPIYHDDISLAFNLVQRIRDMWTERGYTDLSKSKALPYWHIVSNSQSKNAQGWSVQIRADNATFSWPVIMPAHDELPIAITKVALRALENMDNMMELMRIKRHQFEAQRGY